MFTGLVEGCSTVSGIRPDESSIRLAVDVLEVMRPTNDDHPPTQTGDSVAINGCCLTVVAVDQHRWTFEAGRETLSKTNLGDLRPGHRVNLERSLAVDGRLGGHFVQGHIDCVAHVDRVERDGQWVDMSFRLPVEFARLLVPKGSVAVDGVSLTVVYVDRDRFGVALIPHTLESTTLGARRTGDVVNVETDILGKYVHRFLTEDLRDRPA